MSLGAHGFTLLPTSAFEKQKTVHDTNACEVFLARRNASATSGDDAPAGAGAGAEAGAGKEGELIVVRRTKIVGPNSLDSFDLQSELFALCNHPNIVRPLALCMDPPTYAQVLPLAEYGSLYELLHDPAREVQRRALSWPLCFAMARDVAAAIDYLHSELGLLFRDLKPANVLVFGDLSARLTDFDTVKYADENRNRTKTVYHHGPSGGFHKAFIAGTLVYMAPELMLNRPYTTASDVYSLGVTMNELATGCIPYSDVETTTLQFHTVIEANYSQAALMKDITTKDLRPNTVGGGSGGATPATYVRDGAAAIPAGYTELATRCWAPAGTARPTSRAVLEALDAMAATAGLVEVVTDLAVRRRLAAEAVVRAKDVAAATAAAAAPKGAAETAAATAAAGAQAATVPRLARAEATARKSKAKVTARNQFFSSSGQGEALHRRGAQIDWSPFDAEGTAAAAASGAAADGAGAAVGAGPAVVDVPFIPVVRGGGLASFGLRGEDNMEDTFFVHESLDVGSVGSSGYGRVHVYGVADGHAGAGAAVFVQDHFTETLLDVLEEAQASSSKPVSMPEALRATFLRVDAAFVNWAAANDDSSGCALVVCVVVGGTIYVANAGDCRAVLGRKDYEDVQDLSVDHCTSNPAERQRVTEEYGSKIVTTADGKKRVAGRIEATRSIGDPELKKFGLTAEPEVQVYQAKPGDRFVVLATDGVWDVMSSELAGRFMLNTILHEDYGAKRIVGEALGMGSTDNVTAVVLYIYDPASKDHERTSKF